MRFDRLTLFSLLLTALAAGPVFAKETAYDRYAPVYRKEPAKADPLNTPLKEAAMHFLVLPFEIVRWPVDESLQYIERNRLAKKFQWSYEYIEEKGVTPKLFQGGLLSGGADFDLVKMTRQKVRFPDLTAKSWVHYAHEQNFDTGGIVGLERIAETPLRAFTTVNYEKRPNESFFGIGPDTSLGDGTIYKLERTSFEGKVGYSRTSEFEADIFTTLENINITASDDDEDGTPYDDYFPYTIPGRDGDRLLKMGTEMAHDTRNYKQNSTRGGLERIGASFNEGLGDSEARYFKLLAEVSRYQRLGTDRRVVAAHFYGEHNNELPDHEVPFHQMAKMGGYGHYPSVSLPLRAYDKNRFFAENALLFNLEYRYTVYDYREVKADTILFWDEGQVFRDVSDFQFKDFRESYGAGFRVSLLDHVLLSIEIAHGDEGTNYYVKSKAPF